MSKYYKLVGSNAINKNKMNFYRLLYIIGNHIAKKYKNRIKNAIKAVIDNINNEYNINVSNREIKFLIREKETWLQGQVYKISKNADLILKTIFQMISIIEKSNSTSASTLSLGRLKHEKYCRNEIISDFDEKIDELKKAFYLEEEINTLQNKLIQINKIC